MTTGVTVTPAQADQEWTHRWWRRTGWAVLVGWLVVAALTVPGDRETSYHEGLLSDIARAGQITTTPLLDEGDQYMLVRITWDDGLFNRTTEVYDASSPRKAQEVSRTSGVPAVVDLEQRLRQVRPGLVIDQTARLGTYSTYDSKVAGWHVPDGLRLTAIILGVVTFGLVSSGPAPWRANRWAWGWMVLSSPLGIFAFLVLGGPSGLLGRPSTPGRMRGGWGSRGRLPAERGVVLEEPLTLVPSRAWSGRPDPSVAEALPARP